MGNRPARSSRRGGFALALCRGECQNVPVLRCACGVCMRILLLLLVALPLPLFGQDSELPHDVQFREHDFSGAVISHEDGEPAGTYRDFGVWDVNDGATLARFFHVEALDPQGFFLEGVRIHPRADWHVEPLNPSVTPLHSLRFWAAFDPADIGERPGELIFSYRIAEGEAREFRFDLTGRGTTLVVLEVDDGAPVSYGAYSNGSARDFGARPLGTGLTAPATITLTNRGVQTLTLGGFGLSGDSTSFHLNVMETATSLEPGESTELFVAFDPFIPGHKLAMVRFHHNDASKPSPFTFQVRGVAIDHNTPVLVVRLDGPNGPPLPNGALAEGRLDFSTHEQEGGPLHLTFYVKNSGTATLNVAAPISTSGRFIIEAPGWPGALPSGTGWYFSVRHHSAGALNGALSLNHDDPTADTPFIVNLRGAAPVTPYSPDSSSKEDERAGCTFGQAPPLILLALMVLLFSAAIRRQSPVGRIV
jgi:hypothetical protein